MQSKENLRVTLGNFLFKYRTYTPMPLLLALFIFGTPASSGFGVADISAILISFMGEMIRVFAVGYSYHGTSGRENYLRAESLNATGIYSLVRNPLYVGNMLIYTGVMMLFGDFYLLLFSTILLCLQYYFIIGAEESFLKKKYGKEYQEYCGRVEAVIPFSRYVPPMNPFNFNKVFLKEKDSIFNVVAIFLLIGIYRTDSQDILRTWLYISGGLAVTIYAAVKIFKPSRKD